MPTYLSEDEVFGARDKKYLPEEDVFGKAPGGNSSGGIVDAVKNFGTATADIVGDALARERKRRKQEQFDQANAAGKAVVEDSYRSAGPLEVRQAEDRANALALRDESGRATIDTAGEIGRQAVAGVAVDAPKMVNQSLAWFTPDGSAINEFAKEGADYWASGEKDWAQDLEGKGVVGQTLIKGARSMAPSAMVMGAAMANPWVGGAAAATLFGGSQAEDTYERGLQKGLSKDEARKAGWLTGTIEGVGETIGDVAGARFMSGLGKRFLGEIGVKEAEKLAVSPRWAAMFAKDFLENAAIQSATEYGQGFGETAVENRYGISDESPIQQGNEGAQAALGMSVLLGGNAAIGHRQMGQMRKVAGSLLDDAAAPVEQRKEAADFVRDQMEMAGLDKAAAKSWHDGMLATIQHERAPGEQNDSGAISAADILGTAPAFTPADEQAVTSFAQKRLDALEQKANGTEDQAITGPDGKPVTVAGMPAQFLTADERDERDFLRQNIGNPAALAHAYNIKPTDQQEKNSTLAPKAADLADTRPDVPLLRGKPTEFSTETGARISADYALVPAASLITSHDTSLRPNPAYPQELQPRERDRAASETQIATIAQRLDPARLGEAADAANGAPIIGADGLVESGNARTIALKRVYSQGSDKAGAYRQYLKDNAERFGIAPESVDSIENPVLVRVRNTPVNRAEFARQANASTVAQMSPTEQARSDAARIQYMDDLSPTESGDFSTSRDFIRRFVGALPETERGGMMDAGGQLSQSGYARIRNAVLAKAYGNSPALLRMVESLDDNLRNISKALMQAAPQVAKSRDGIAQGALYPIDVTQDLLHAVEELSRLRDAGISVHDALAQTSLVVEDDLRPETKALLQFLDENIRRPRRIADFIRAYVDALDAVGNPNQGSMFGSAVPTRSDLIDSARSTVNAEPTAKEFAPAFSRGEPAKEGGSQSDESQSGGTGPGKSEWVAFPPESGTLGIPQAEMPQVKGDHRGALIQYLDGRGITHETLEDQPASDYKPTQAEFSTKKAEKWKNVRDGADRSVLASSDGYILDGHHQWLAALATGEPIKVIKFDAPIRELLAAVHEFPSSHKAEGAGSVDPRERARLDFHAAMAELGDVFRQINPGVRMFTPEEKTKIMPVLVKLFGAGIRLGIMDMKKLMAHVKDALKTHANEWVRKNWNKIDTATYNEAARIALERHDNGVNAKNYTNPKADIPLFSRSTSVWFSQLARAIDGAPDRVFGQAQQVKLWLLSNSGKLGVKKEEIQATGITDWLDTQSRVTKEQVQEFLKNNGVKVEEVTLGEPSEKQAEYERRRNEIENLRDWGGQISAHEAQRRLKELRQELGFDEFGQPVTETKFHTYQLPGGENYRELLLTLPQKEAPAPKTDLEARKQIFDAYADRINDLHERVSDPQLDQAARDDALVEMHLLQEERDRRAAGAGGEVYDPILEDPKFISGHFPATPNILAHVRFNERTDAHGRRVLFIEEIQSDFGQSYRKQKDAISKAVDDDFLGIVERMKKSGELSVECD